MMKKLKKALALFKKAAVYLGKLIGLLEKATKDEPKKEK